MLFLVNRSSPKKRGRTTSNPERPLEFPTAIIEGEHQLLGVTSVLQQEEPLGMSEYTLHQQPLHPPVIPALESVPAVEQCAVMTSEPSSTPGALVENAGISISEYDLPQEPLPTSDVPAHADAASHQLLTFRTSGESYGISNTFSSVVGVGTSEQSSQKGLLKGRI
jgi:hypothetical protein